MKNNLTAEVKKTNNGFCVSIYELKPVNYCVYTTFLLQKIRLIAPGDNFLHYSYRIDFYKFGNKVIYFEIDIRNDVAILVYDCEHKDGARVLFRQNYSKLEHENAEN